MILLNEYSIGQPVRCLFDGQVGTVDMIAEASHGAGGLLTYRIVREGAKANERILWSLAERLEPASNP
jgi:hypothetical protein